MPDGPILYTWMDRTVGSCSSQKHTVCYTIWSKWGDEGKRINLGMYLAGHEDLIEIRKDPNAGRILSETCTRNVYRDIESFEYVSENKYNE